MAKRVGKAADKGQRMGSTLAGMVLGAVTMAGGVADTPAQASIPPQDRVELVQTYSIPAGSMASALNAFADVNDLHLAYDARVTKRLQTQGLYGAFSVTEGLDRLLGGTGLTYRLTDKGHVVLIQLAQADNGTMNDASAPGAETLPPIDIGAEWLQPAGSGSGSGSGGSQGSADGKNALGGRLTGYNASNATSALKMDAPIMQTPVSVQVVTRQTMDDKQAINVIDAITTNVSGVQPYASYFEQYKVRGFTVYPYRDGLLQYTTNYVDTSNIQSIEVMKGPASVLYGRLEPGGLIDIVVKRPQETPYYSVMEQVGSYGLTRTTVDATGPLTADHSLLYRFNADYFREDSFRDFVNDRQVFLAPTIQWRPIEQFRLNVDFEYQHRFYVDDYPVFPAVGGAPAQIPLSRYLQQPGVLSNPPNEFDRKFIAYDWKWDFMPDWSLTNRLSYTNTVLRTADSGATAFNAVTGNMTTDIFNYPGYDQQELATNVDIKGKFATGPLQHSVLLGYDHFIYAWPTIQYFTSNTQNMNIYYPIYAPLQNLYASTPSWSESRQKWDGLYGQDMISAFDDKVHLLLGGRFDWSRTGASSQHTSPALAAATFADHYDHGFSPRIGLLVQPFPWLSLYGNFTQSLGANNGATSIGVVLPAQRGEQFEGGVKTEFFDKRLTATAAYFDITKTNITEPDPTNPNNTLLVGKVRSRGFEFDLTGRVNDNWSVIANYTHDDVRVVTGVETPNFATEITTEQAIAGNVMPGSPRNYGNVWLKYEADGALKGLSVAGGVTAVSNQFGDNANSFTLPAYTLLNGMIAYRWKINGYTITAQLNAKNLTDTRYFATAANRTTIMPGTPQTFVGSLRLEF
jgi:iron complex outermembrane receptor protein